MPLGIPHSVFLSWNPDDQDKHLAYVRAKNEICPECGTREEDWRDPTTMIEHNPPRWEPLVVRCVGCTELERERKSLKIDSSAVRVVAAPFDPTRREAWEFAADEQQHDGWAPVGQDEDPEPESQP